MTLAVEVQCDWLWKPANVTLAMEVSHVTLARKVQATNCCHPAAVHSQLNYNSCTNKLATVSSRKSQLPHK